MFSILVAIEKQQINVSWYSSEFGNAEGIIVDSILVVIFLTGETINWIFIVLSFELGMSSIFTG